MFFFYYYVIFILGDIVRFDLNKYLPRIIASWLSIMFFQNIDILYNLEITNMYIFKSFIIFIISFVFYTLLNKKIKKINIDSLVLLVNYSICTLLWLNKNTDLLFMLGISIFFVIIVFYFININKEIIRKIKLSKKFYIILGGLVILIPFFILLVISILRYYNYSSPNFDFGIFSHMFYYMKETFIPFSTCERDILLSHFAVHFSPILYLILPIYYLFSSPVVLQISQVVILYLGLIPLIKLCNFYKFSYNRKLFVILLYSFYPILSSGTFFDFHENCFVPFLLLFTFYFFEKNSRLVYLFLILSLIIKEDVFIYLVIFGIYIILSRKRIKQGVNIIIISLLYFSIVSFFMTKYGLGIMSDRYENLIYNDSGILGAIKTILFNPGYTLSQIFSTPSKSFDKLIYLGKLFIPVVFLPIITKKVSRYILLVPLLLNLLTNYTYMYDVNFHYSYGILAFLFYLIILNIKDIKKLERMYIFSFGIMFCLLSYYCFVVPSFKNNVSDYINNKSDYKIIRDVLKNIPKSSSVSSSTFYLPYLTNRKELYEVYYHNNKLDIDYVVLDMRYEDNREYLDFYLDNNYIVVEDRENLIIVLKKNKYVD